MNLLEMRNNVKAECHPITNIDSIINRWLNRGQKVVASKGPKGGWFWLRQYGYTATTTASSETVMLSHLVDTSKIITLYDTAQPQSLQYMPEQSFRNVEPGPTATGDGYLYRLKGFAPVQNQPSSASVLTLVSSSVSDTATVVYVQGLNSSSVLTSETMTINGTTNVVSTNSYAKVLAISKSATSVGNFTITSNSAAVTNTVIPASQRVLSYPVIAIFNIPDSADTLTYDFTLKLPDIASNNDISMIPEQYHDAIELYAKIQCFKHLNNPTMATLVSQEFDARINDMTLDGYQPNGVFSMNSSGRATTVREARLPSMYPTSY